MSATSAADSGAGDEAAIVEVGDRWWAATTAEEVCELMSQGLKTSMAAVDDCPARIQERVDEGHFGLEATEATVTDVVIEAPKAVVTYDMADEDEPIYMLFVKNLDTWLVDGQTNEENLPGDYRVLLEDA